MCAVYEIRSNYRWSQGKSNEIDEKKFSDKKLYHLLNIILLWTATTIHEKKIFGRKTDEELVNWGALNNEDLHYLCF